MSLSGEEIRRGFWYHRPAAQWPPECITHPGEYTRGDKLNVVCTQLPVSQSEQRRIVKAWCEALPTLSDVRYLWFSSRVSQPMFDAACRMPNLEGLYVKWSGVKDISGLTAMSRLRYFHLGSSAQLESIACVSELTHLLVLELQGVAKISDLSPLAGLSRLEGLAVEGGMQSTQVVDTLAPLSQLHQLRYLFLAALKSRDGTLRPLSSLRSLVNLRTTFGWPEGEFAMLRKELLNLRYGTPFEKLPRWVGKESH